MAHETPPRDAPFLKRWSQRKLAASREAASPPRVESAVAPGAPAATQPASPAIGLEAPEAKVELPPVDSLTFESDFSAFLRPGVDDSLRRTALRKLVRDPRFNVMDGLDVYIDDYNKFEPIPDDVLAKLEHVRYLFDPPKTRVNALGYVEDVPEEEEQEASAQAAEPVPGDQAAASNDDGQDALPARIEVASVAPPAPTLQPAAEPAGGGDAGSEPSR